MTVVLWVVGGGWLSLGSLGALVIGRSIRLADRQDLEPVEPASPAQAPPTLHAAVHCTLRRRRSRGTPPAVSRCIVATHRAASNRES
jgi:hypothetical protein